jgi:hypothetical protein
METTTTPPSEKADAIAEFKEARQRLREEREHLIARLKVIDETLEEHSGQEFVSSPKHTNGGRARAAPLDTTTTGALVRSILARNPHGMSSPKIIEAVIKAVPGTEPRAVHAALRGARKTGERRSFLYFPSEDD